jgi:hypothetical protein
LGKGLSKKAAAVQTNVADKSSGISDQLRTDLMPYLKQSGDYYTNLIKGDPATLTRQMSPQINLSNMAYDNAKQQIERTTPSGGVRTQALTDLATKRAGSTTSILNSGITEALQHLEGLGQFGTQGSLQGLSVSGQAGDSLARLSAAKAQAVGQGIAGLAGGAGSILGSLAGGSGSSGSGTGGYVPPALPTGGFSSAISPSMSASGINFPGGLPLNNYPQYAVPSWTAAIDPRVVGSYPTKQVYIPGSGGY